MRAIDQDARQGTSMDHRLLDVIVVGFFVATVLIAADAANTLSFKKTYDAIQLGMSRDQATTIMRSEKMYTGFADKQGSAITVARFNDFWRYYQIWLDPKTGSVAGKQFGWVVHREPFTNLARDLRSVW